VITPLIFVAMIPAANSDSTMAMVSLVGMQVLVSVLQNVVMIFIGVRLAPAAATSIARRRFAFFEAWKVTKGRFWALFGSFFVLMLVYIVALLFFIGVGFGAFASVFVSGAPPTAETLAALITPSNIALVGMLYGLLIVSGVFYVVLSFGVNARAVIAAIDEGKIDGQSPNVAEVFS